MSADQVTDKAPIARTPPENPRKHWLVQTNHNNSVTDHPTTGRLSPTRSRLRSCHDGPVSPNPGQGAKPDHNHLD